LLLLVALVVVVIMQAAEVEQGVIAQVQDLQLLLALLIPSR
jgi:hypothetical protein